jgi:hypothetical protein
MLNKRHVCYDQLAILQLHDHNEQNTMGLSIVGVPHLKHKDSFLRPPNSPFCSRNLWHVLDFPFFSHVKWNNFASNFIWTSKFLFLFFTYECKKYKIYPMWIMFYQWPKFPKFSFFEILYIAIGRLVIVTFEHFIYISKLRCLSLKSWGKIIYLNIPHGSLNFFFLMKQSSGKFSRTC